MANGKYTAEQIIEAIHASHGNLASAARRLKCGRSTVYRYLDNHPTIKAAYEEERETLIDFTEDQLFKQVQAGNITAIIFTLKTIGKHRGYIERSDINLIDPKLTIEYVNDWRNQAT